jgi:hypothetical protein
MVGLRELKEPNCLRRLHFAFASFGVGYGTKPCDRCRSGMRLWEGQRVVAGYEKEQVAKLSFHDYGAFHFRHPSRWLGRFPF